MAHILITGGAGFIGFHLHRKLETKHQISAFDLLASDNIATRNRTAHLKYISQNNIHNAFIDEMQNKPDVIIHLAAETGISGSLTNPQKYFEANVQGTYNVLEQCRKNNVKYLVYASSSSVYEPSEEMSETTATAKQLSFYGTTKKMSEMMIENYCRQFGMTAIGLRFFTVYGSWTRPDMAGYKFMKAIDEEKTITAYSGAARDFTHISDITASVELIIDKIMKEPQGYHDIFNIGYGDPVNVEQYAQLIAQNIGKKLRLKNEALPANELLRTHSNSTKLFDYIGRKPQISIETGVKEMTEWFKHNKYE